MAKTKDGVWTDKKRNGEIYESTLKAGKYLVTVHRHIHYKQDVWLASSQGLFICNRCQSKELEHAKIEAAALLKQNLQDALSHLENW